MNGSPSGVNSPHHGRDSGNGNSRLFHDRGGDYGSDNSDNGEGSDADDVSFSENCDRAIISNNDEPVTWKNFFKHITIEPIMFAQMMGLSLSSVVTLNLYIDRICKVSLGYEDKVCGNLSHWPEIETEIDEIASKFVTYRSLIEAGFPIIVALFLGPWTDIHGTKWPMLMPLIGFCLSSLSYLTFTQIPTAPPELFLISSVPISLVGGLVAFVMSTFSFIAKMTTIEKRSFRVAMLEASWFLGGPVGTLTGGLIYKYGGFAAVFSTSAGLFIGAFLYGCFVIREELPEIEGRERRNCCADLVNIGAVKNMFSTVFLRRSGTQRRWLLLMLFTISLRIFALFGYIQNMYLYTRNKVNWDLKQYTEYSVTDSLVGISGGYVMITVCMKILKLPDAVVGILSSIGVIASQFIFAFAVHGWMMYLGAAFQTFSGLISIVLRSMISKIVVKEEIAKVFTFLACGEASMPLIGVPLFSYIFRHTLDTFPGAMFMVSAGAYIFILFSFIYLYFSMRNSSNHVQLQHPTETES